LFDLFWQGGPDPDLGLLNITGSAGSSRFFAFR
jgi:hypothetical protein